MSQYQKNQISNNMSYPLTVIGLDFPFGKYVGQACTYNSSTMYILNREREMRKK